MVLLTAYCSKGPQFPNIVLGDRAYTYASLQKRETGGYNMNEAIYLLGYLMIQMLGVLSTLILGQ